MIIGLKPLRRKETYLWGKYGPRTKNGDYKIAANHWKLNAVPCKSQQRIGGVGIKNPNKLSLRTYPKEKAGPLSNITLFLLLLTNTIIISCIERTIVTKWQKQGVLSDHQTKGQQRGCDSAILWQRDFSDQNNCCFMILIIDYKMNISTQIIINMRI